MSTLATINTLVPNANVPLGYFDEDNIVFVQRKIREVLKREFKQNILFDRASVIRLMGRSLLDRVDTVPFLNQRAIMYGTNEYRNYQLEVDKNLKLEAHYVLSQRLYDPSVEVIRYDPQTVFKPNRLGDLKVGGTTRFYFT
jgi:hypothetical protein